MTTDIEKQFFDTFGIEPKLTCKPWKCPQYGAHGRDKCVKKLCAVDEDCWKNKENTSAFYVYPEITDGHYLKMLEILLNFEYIGIKKGKAFYSIDFQGWLEQEESSLKGCILKTLCVVVNSEFKNVVYNEVQALFKEEK